MASDSPIQYSIVVPFYNEQENIPPLYMKLTEVMDGIGEPYELVFVDDGSKDDSFKVLSEIYEHDRRVNLVRLRRNFGLASPPAGPLADAAASQPHRQLDDGKTFGNRFARFWNNVQSLPQGDHSGNSALRRAAPLHPGAGKFHGGENRGSAHRESRAQEWKIQLRDRAHDPRLPGFDYREVFIGLFDAPAPVFRAAGRGRGGAGFPARVLPSLRKILSAQGHHGGARATDDAVSGAVHQRRAVFFHGIARRNHCAHLL